MMIEHDVEADRIGDCPVCWNLVDLNVAGRIRSHGGGCPGVGSLPRSYRSEQKRRSGIPDNPDWWRNPTCQECAAYLCDSRGRPRWELTAEVMFVCLNGCRRTLEAKTIAQLVHEGGPIR